MGSSSPTRCYLSRGFRVVSRVALLHSSAICTLAPKVEDDYILESFLRVQEFAPDFVVYTGDWITYRSIEQFEQLRRVMAHASHGRLGTVGILGNHDYGFGWQMPDMAEEVSKIVRAAGITVHRNVALHVAGLQFLGLDDLCGPRFDPVQLLAQRGQDASTLVLCHNPDAADCAVWGRYQGWILAGIRMGAL
jgi:uncharacterized protein